MKPRTITTAVLCAAALAALPAAASASSRQLAIFQDERLLLERGETTQLQTLSELRGLGVDVIKLQVDWAEVAPLGKRKPAGFNGSDPSDYPAARWAKTDTLVRNAQARGFQVMIALSGPAPGWATRKKGDTVGVDRPSGTEYGRFVQAVGKRYPSVRIWTILNEPNHPRFLFPQATRRRIPYAPRLYRSLVAGAVRGLRRSGHGGDRILFGELLPIGKRRVFRKNTLKPILFLREFFCLDSHWRPYRGRAARAHGCKGFRKVTGVNGFAYHPYTRPNGPRGKEPSRNDATIRSIRRVTRVLDIARRKRRLGGPRRMKVYNTEFGYQSNPPDPYQTRIGRIPGFLSEAEWISFRNRRVASWSQYTMVDDPLTSGGGFSRYSTWQGGLRFSDGKLKSDVYNAFRLPFFVRLLGPSAIEVWGAARPGGAGARVQVEQRSNGGSFAGLGGAFTTTNVRGYFRQRFQIAKAAKRVYRFKYLTGGTAFTSRTAKAVVR